MALIDDVTNYWKFDNNLTDSAGSNGASNFGATYTASGKINGCYDWDGSNDYMTLGDTNVLDGATTFSISGWVSQQTLTDREVLFIKRVDSTHQIYIESTTEGALRFAMYDGTGTYANYTNYSADISSNTFFFLVIVYNGNGATNADKVKMYINGSEEALTFGGTIPSTSPSNSATTYLGRYLTEILYWDGKIDEFAFWSTALSGADVTELYNSGDGLQYPFSTGLNLQLNIGDSWKAVPAAKINIGDSWKAVTVIKQNIGDSWKTV